MTSTWTTRFREAFATRPHPEDTDYCAPLIKEAQIKPKVCTDLVEIADNSYVSPEEIAEFGKKWKDGASTLQEIGGTDGKALQWARIAYLKDQVVTKWWRWDASDEDRIQMIREMQGYATSAPFPALVEVLKEGTGPVQDAAREALGHMSTAPDRRSAIDAATESISGEGLSTDEYNKARDAALATVTAKIQLDSVAVDDVVAALSDPDVALRLHAIHILGRMGMEAQAAGLMPLAKVATDPHAVIRNAAVEAMYRMVMGEKTYYWGDKFPPVPDAAADYLLRHMTMDSNPTWEGSVSSTATALLDGCSPRAIEPLIPNLIAIFNNPYRPDFLRWYAVDVLQRDDLRHPQAVPAMVEFLKEDESVCSSNALNAWGDTDALVSMVPEIEKIALNDRLKTEPRFQALLVLGEVGRRLKKNQSFPVFVESLDIERNSMIQGIALSLLRDRLDNAILTPDDILELWKPLQALLKSENSEIRDRAAEWIEAIPSNWKPVTP